MEKLVILGSGPAGLTAAVYAARSGVPPVVAEGPMPGGLLTRTGSIENFPGFPDGIDGYEFTERMRRQAEKYGAEILPAQASEILLCPEAGIHEIRLSGGRILRSERLILALGSQPRWLGLPSEQKFRGRGVSVCAHCDGPLYRKKPVCVAGGGNSALEQALFLSRLTHEVHLIHRRDTFRASRIMIDRAMNDPAIHPHLSCTIEEILGTDHVEGVRLRHTDGTEESIPCAGFFAALGYVPNTQMLRGQIETDEAGYIRTFDGTTKTSVPGVFAAGDCADSRYRQAVTAAGTGCQAALDALEDPPE